MVKELKYILGMLIQMRKIIKIKSWYNFVEMDYHSSFYIKTGREIVVSLDKNKQLQSYMNEKVNP
ncbi:hypothetical protein [Paenibacillus turicensis]|uniref:hypothetical protein n=1 Tax=Paenibacillus turicensis TaxID=160487 RepID=UPI001AE9BC67|nr:hypothetical protein [Paenibacillus turicensis]